MNEEQEILTKLKALAGAKAAVIQGTVISVDTNNYTATIKLDDAGEVTQVVRLTAIQGSGQFIVFPEVGTLLLAARILNVNKWVMITCDGVSEVWLRGDEYTVPISANVATQLNNIETDINSLKNLFIGMAAITPIAPVTTSTLSGLVSAWTGSLLSPTTESDIENTKVKHG